MSASMTWSFPLSDLTELDLLLLLEWPFLLSLDVLLRERLCDLSRFRRLRRLSLRLDFRLFLLAFFDFFLRLELRLCFRFRELLLDPFFVVLSLRELLLLLLDFFFLLGDGLGLGARFFGEGEGLEELLGDRLLLLEIIICGSMTSFSFVFAPTTLGSESTEVNDSTIPELILGSSGIAKSVLEDDSSVTWGIRSEWTWPDSKSGLVQEVCPEPECQKYFRPEQIETKFSTETV